LPRNYGHNDWIEGKSLCKAALQQELGLPVRDDVPLVGFIGRLVAQKGLDLIEPVLNQRVERDQTQWVFLGSGSPEYEELLRRLAARFPERVAVRLEFSNPLAHRIEAASDIFLMPSLYEPCGLNQMYSLKYGTVPLVRATGGLADTISNVCDETLIAGTANGFSFLDYTPQALDETLSRAKSQWQQKDTWARIVEIGMKQDWSWDNSARLYIALYHQTLTRKRKMARPRA
jgi:starch synthase